jgi:hypothetical protein
MCPTYQKQNGSHVSSHHTDPQMFPTCFPADVPHLFTHYYPLLLLLQ